VKVIIRREMPLEESFKALINIFRRQKKDPCHTAIPDASPEVTINLPYTP
jgi:hypothetical protein